MNKLTELSKVVSHAPNFPSPAHDEDAARFGEETPQISKALHDDLRRPIVIGGIVVLVLVVGLILWAALASISGAVLAAGTVRVENNSKQIRHLEPGIIKQILVREGQRVAAGELLMTLDPVRAEANFAGQQGQWMRLLVTRARLQALAAGENALSLPEDVTGVTDPAFLDFVETEQRLFEIRQTTLSQQEQILGRRVEQLGSEIESVRAESVGLKGQMDLISEEIADKQRLLDQQLISRSQVMALQRELARLQSAIASNDARIAQAQQSIEETRLTSLQTRETFFDEVAEQMRQVNDQIAQIDEGLRQTGDALRRTDIVSPVDGIVLNLVNQTPGGVVRPGETIMEVVPVNEDMIVVARLAPKDIDVVTIGLKAHVTLVPFATRNTLPLNGEVTQVAADSKVDPMTGAHFYEVRVGIPPEELARHEGMYLSPGMPADVTVVTGERTMFHYLFDPVWRSLQTAFVYD